MSSKIARLHKTKIELEKIQILDTENAKSEDGLKDPLVKKSSYIGDISPFIRIQEMTFSHREIIYFEITTTHFLPRIRVDIIDPTGAFGEAYFPKTNPILSVYIRSRHSKLMAIRNDYLITSVYSSPTLNVADAAENKGSTYSINGELFIPLMKTPFVGGFDGTSFELLSELSKTMKLGFSTNEDATNDKMIWLNHNAMADDFIKDHLTPHSYKNELSFYNSFVDIYYNLNFINMYSMINEKHEIEDSYNTFIQNLDFLRNDASGASEFESKLMLTNSSFMKETSLFIQSFAPITKQGKLLSTEGYTKTLNYYNPLYSTDDLNENFLTFRTSPYGIIIPDEDKNENLKNLKNTTSYYYSGIDYGNNHENFKYAKVLHSTGMNELNKILIKVTLGGVNLTLMKNMQIPVLIVTEGKDPNKKAIVYKTQENSKYKDIFDTVGLMIDKNYTGQYVIKDISYVYNPNAPNTRYSFTTELILSKNEWEKSPDYLLLDKLEEGINNIDGLTVTTLE